MATTIVITGGTDSTNAPATGASFLDIWGNDFANAIISPSPWDYISGGVGIATGGVSAAATAGLSKAMKSATDSAFRTGVDLPFSFGTGTVPSMALGAAESGAVGFFRELAGGTFSTLAGWAVGETAVDVALAGAAFVAAPEALAVGLGLFATTVLAYAAGKAVTSGIDAFNTWRQQASDAGASVVNTLADGTVVTTNPDQSYSVSRAGNSYDFDASGNLTSTFIANQGITVHSDNTTGTLTATNSTGAQVASVNATMNQQGSMVLTDPTSGQLLGTWSHDTSGYTISDPKGDQTTFSAGGTPTLVQKSADGTITNTTTVAADGTVMNTWQDNAGDSGTNIFRVDGTYTLNSTWPNDSSTKSTIGNADGSSTTTVTHTDGSHEVQELNADGNSETDSRYDTSGRLISVNKTTTDRVNQTTNVDYTNYTYNGNALLEIDKGTWANGADGTHLYGYETMTVNVPYRFDANGLPFSFDHHSGMFNVTVLELSYNRDGSSTEMEKNGDGDTYVEKTSADHTVIKTWNMTSGLYSSGKNYVEQVLNPDGSSYAVQRITDTGVVDGTTYSYWYADGSAVYYVHALDPTPHDSVNYYPALDGTPGIAGSTDPTGVGGATDPQIASWTGTDGSSGTTTTYADGTVLNTSTNADGSSGSTADFIDGSSNTTTTAVDGSSDNYSYFTDGTIIDQWSYSDGSHGTNTTYADGTYDNVTYGGDGSSSHSWTKTDGSFGYDTVSSDGSTVHSVQNADGSSDTSTVNSWGSSSHAWVNADGSGGIDNYYEDGSQYHETFYADGSDYEQSIAADGSYSIYTANADTSSYYYQYDSAHYLVSDTLQGVDGLTRNDQFIYNTDGSFVDTWSMSDGSAGTNTYSASVDPKSVAAMPS